MTMYAPSSQEPDAAADAPSEPRGRIVSPRAAERRRQHARVAELTRRLEAALPAPARHLVAEFEDALNEARGLEHDDWRDRFIDGLAGHFPGFGPAIRSVAVHIDETCELLDVNDPRADPCGLVRAAPPDYRLDGCAGAADEVGEDDDAG